MEVEMNKFNSWLRMVAQLNTTDNLPLFEFREGCKACEGKYDSCQGHLNAENLKKFIFNNDSRNAALAEWFAGIDTSNWIIMNGDEVWADIEKSWPDADLAEGEKKPTTIKPIIGYKTPLKAGGLQLPSLNPLPCLESSLLNSWLTLVSILLKSLGP